MNHHPRHSETTDELLTILANHHCRATVTYFCNSTNAVASVETLATEINERDHGGVKQVAVRLHHSVLPRLAAANVVDYDSRSRTARYHGHPVLETLLADTTACDQERTTTH